MRLIYANQVLPDECEIRDFQMARESNLLMVVFSMFEGG